MALAKPIAILRKELQTLLVEDLPAALSALKELIPESSDKHGQVVALQAGLKQLNKDKTLGVIDMAEYRKGLARLNADCYDLIRDLTESDFLEESDAAKAAAGKQGSVLYRVPHKMPLAKPSICTIRVAMDAEAILEDIILDEDIRHRSKVEVSDRMSAELIDTEGNIFEIVCFNPGQQTIRETGYTQWLFRVTPRVEGEHQLLVKVSLLEFDRNTNEYVPRDVSIMETVTIVTETAAPAELDESPLKSSGHQFAVGPKHPIYHQSLPRPKPLARRSLRVLAIFLGFLILVPGMSWAFTPELDRGLWLASLEADWFGISDGLDTFILAHKNDPAARPYVDKAYYRKGVLTNLLVDLREYQREFPKGDYEIPVRNKIALLEKDAFQDLQSQPSLERIRHFVTDFPESEHLLEVWQIALRAGITDGIQSLLENAYVTSIQQNVSVQKVRSYLRDFPLIERLDEVADAAATKPLVFKDVQPDLENAYLNRLEQNLTPASVRAFLLRFPEPILKDRFEKLLEEKVILKKTTKARSSHAKAPKTSGKRVANEDSGKTGRKKDSDHVVDSLAMEEAKNREIQRIRDSIATENNKREIERLAQRQEEERAWNSALEKNTLSNFDQFLSNFPEGLHREEARNKINTLSNPDLVIYNMNLIEGNSFRMGHNGGNSNSEPAHDVILSDFYLSTYEVTVGEYLRFADAMQSHYPCWLEKGHRENIETGTDNKYKIVGYSRKAVRLPIAGISWYDADAYCKWLSNLTGKDYRLPTEAEWEYAASLDTNRYMIPGMENNLRLDPKSENETYIRLDTLPRPVGSQIPNMVGLYDMFGNVYEWCSDWYALNYYRIADKPNNPTGPLKGYDKACRGGSWNDPRVGYSTRASADPKNRLIGLGFRVARSR